MDGHSWSSGARTLAWVAAVVIVLYVIGSFMLASEGGEPSPPASSCAQSSGSMPIAEPGSGSSSPLRYPGDTDLFERGVNVLVPWTSEISQEILVLSAQDICTELSRTGDPVAARSIAMGAGFFGADVAPFVEQAVNFFCPRFKDVVPEM